MSTQQDAELTEAYRKFKADNPKIGRDTISSNEGWGDKFRHYLPDSLRTLSLMFIGGRLQSLEKAGKFREFTSGTAAASEADHEHSGALQLGSTRDEAKDSYRWTNDPLYKSTVRKQALERDCNTCQFCGRVDRLQVHHRSYKRCRTPQEINDVITLCQFCHSSLHKAWESRRTGKLSPLQIELGNIRNEYGSNYLAEQDCDGHGTEAPLFESHSRCEALLWAED